MEITRVTNCCLCIEFKHLIFMHFLFRIVVKNKSSRPYLYFLREKAVKSKGHSSTLRQKVFDLRLVNAMR